MYTEEEKRQRINKRKRELYHLAREKGIPAKYACVYRNRVVNGIPFAIETERLSEDKVIERINNITTGKHRKYREWLFVLMCWKYDCVDWTINKLAEKADTRQILDELDSDVAWNLLRDAGIDFNKYGTGIKKNYT